MRGKKDKENQSKKTGEKAIKPFLKAENKDRTAFGLKRPGI
jgi:hypothetical protein